MHSQDLFTILRVHTLPYTTCGVYTVLLFIYACARPIESCRTTENVKRIFVLSYRTEEPVIPPLAAVTAFIPSPDVQVLDMPVDPNEPTYCLCHQVRAVNMKDRSGYD